MTQAPAHQIVIASPSGAVWNSLSGVVGAALLMAAIPLTTINFTTDFSDQQFAVDWQTLLRLGLCAACGVYGLHHLPRTSSLFRSFPGVWCILFGLWVL